MPRILHVADIHARQSWLDWIMTHAVGFDLLCIAGDLQDAFAPAGMHAQAKALRPWLLQLPIPTIVCTGNHDWWPEDERARDVYAEGGWVRMLAGKANIVAVDGGVAEVGGIRIASVGWNQRPVWPVGTDIAVCHAAPPPLSVAGDENESSEEGTETLRALAERPPRFFLCGHIHTPRRQWCWFPSDTRQTLFLNPGCCFSSAEPYRWEIDTATGLAIWRGAGVDEVGF